MSRDLSGREESDGLARRELGVAARVMAGAADNSAAGDLPWAVELLHAVRGMREELARHRARSEAEDGPLDEVLNEKGALRTQVEEQEGEHRDLIASLDSLDARLSEQLQFRRIRREELGLEAKILIDRYRLHMMRAGDLVYEAYFQEEGGEG